MNPPVVIDPRYHDAVIFDLHGVLTDAALEGKVDRLNGLDGDGVGQHARQLGNELDDLGKLPLANLALAYGCMAKVEDAERRIYFSK